VRRGQVDALRSVPDVEVVAAVDPCEARTWTTEWDTVDVVVVDAYDEREDWDRFPGVAVVEAARARRRPEDLLIVVVTGHVMNDLLRLRMAEAGADFYYGRSDVRSLSALVRAIVDPEQARRVTPGDRNRLATLGLRSTSRPNRALAYVRESGLADAFAAGGGQKSLDVSRRKIIMTRERLADLAGLDPLGDDVGGPERARHIPTWREVVRFINRARGADVDPRR
jgi:DNA-binding NarL/FixJ family response regulator